MPTKKYKCPDCGRESETARLICRSIIEPTSGLFYFGMYDKLLGTFIPICEKCHAVLRVFDNTNKEYRKASVIQFVKLVPYKTEEKGKDYEIQRAQETDL